ncbi:hypothetical protein J5D21_06445 [Helicobacter pylori]|nr:hypothetical protein [Helicobacter pylori]EJB93356.1 hypothetical protein HPHPH23_1624 [Helicobacter pylori Hp H-23]QTP00610.1 hypothetical protein J5D21_06445 [Helicobacter pylori]
MPIHSLILSLNDTTKTQLPDPFKCKSQSMPITKTLEMGLTLEPLSQRQ